ncbi:MAG: 50S ribosomal protein L19 [Patescibacteria group bacterium]
MNKIEIFNKNSTKSGLPDIRPADMVRVYQKIKEGGKDKIQEFEGLVLAVKHGKGISGTVTVRKVASGVGVERIFPIHSPNIEKIEILKRGKVRRAKIYYLREARGKKARLKREEYKAVLPQEETPVTAEESKPEEIK